MAVIQGIPGDVLLQVLYHARMLEEQDAFDFVVQAITEKLLRRHPTRLATPAGPRCLWDRIKTEEKADRAQRRRGRSARRCA